MPYDEQRAAELLAFGQETLDAHPPVSDEINPNVQRQFTELYTKFSDRYSRMRREASPDILASAPMQSLREMHELLRQRHQEYRNAQLTTAGRRRRKSRRVTRKGRKRTSRR